ncbi:MAG: histidine phosphatase family protein [Alphaproteobacteria bacterium]|nr:histidine phosphatase family protein [Alphaproteobacteria bacterium]
MRKDFYIFRHGETDENLAGRWQGCGVDFPLNQTGLFQAKTLADRLQYKGIEIIYSSPLKRAYQTAEVVAAKCNVKIITMSEFTEGCLGVCEGMYKKDIATKYPDIWDAWYSDDMNMETRWPGGESKQEMQQRMSRGIEKLLSVPQKIIGVASHSGSMRYFLYKFGYGPHKMPNTALFHLIYENGEWTLEQL